MVLRGGVMNSSPCPRHQIGPINFIFRESKVYSCPVMQKKIELDSDILKWFSRGRKKKSGSPFIIYNGENQAKSPDLATFFTSEP